MTRRALLVLALLLAASSSKEVRALDISTPSQVYRTLGTDPPSGGFIREDFLSSTVAIAGTFYAQAGTYQLRSIVGVPSLTSPTANLLVPGVWDITTTAVIGVHGQLQHAQENAQTGWPGLTTGTQIFETRLRFEVATDSYGAVGLGTLDGSATTLVSQANAIWCDVTNAGGAGTWACHIRKAGVTTNITLSPAQTATAFGWQSIGIQYRSTSGTTITFEQVPVGTNGTTFAAATALTPTWEIRTDAAAIKRFRLDAWTMLVSAP